jgi:hypothetical protein
MIVLVKPKKPAAAPAPAAATPPAPPAQKTAVAAASAPAKAPAAPAKAAGGGFKFLKRGSEAQKLMQEEETKAAVRAQMRERDQVRRYWLPAGGQGAVTFLDGNLKDGVLDIPYAYEHQVLMNGHRRNWFLCTQEEEPCPICEAASSGGERAQYVGYLTVIDHSEFKGRDGKVYKDQVRLFAAKKDTVKLLQTMAVKRGGLRGCRFDVARVGDKSASVGSAFDFTEKFSDAQLKQMYKDSATPINYETYTQLLYQPADELRKLGFGSLSGPIGSEKGAGADEGNGDAEGYDV